jgi:hypothetical protein
LADGAGNVVGKAASLQSDIQDVSTATNNLTISFYAMLGWVVIITAAIVAVAVVTYRRRRNLHQAPDELWDSNSSSDAGSYRVASPSAENARHQQVSDSQNVTAAADVNNRHDEMPQTTVNIQIAEPIRIVDSNDV